VKLHQVFRLSLWLALAVNLRGLSAELSPEKLYEKVLPSVMTLEVESQSGEKFVGSAVLALADDVALTAWHVVADARSVWAIFADGQRVKVTGCIDQDVGRDLALLKLEKRLPHRQAVLCRERPSVAARAYVIGAPKGYDFSISDGLISQIRSVDGFPQYQLTCPISPGNSGSPVLNNRGEVIGLASWTKSDAQNVSFAIPAQEFSRLHVSHRPVSWAQLAVTTHPTPPARLVTARFTTGTAPQKTADGSFAAFQKWLHDSAGKSVTVVAQESGRTNVFNFTVE
jgi:serine protease Do